MKSDSTGVTTAIVLDSRREKANSTYPVKLRVTYQRTQHYYATGLSLTPDDFKKAMQPKPRGVFKDHSLYLSSVDQKAIQIIKQLPFFTFTSFAKHFRTIGKDVDSVYSAYEAHIKKLYTEGSPSTAGSYECSLRSLKNVTGRKQLSFKEITVDLLKNYERKMLQSGNSLTTVSIYVRCLRTLYNEAIDNGIAKREQYPFGKRRYQVPASINIKKALLLSDIEKIFNYPASNENKESWARDMWMLSYLCNGVNIKDLSRLKYKNIQGNSIIFIRAKTERTSRRRLKPIVVAITPVVSSIIDRWKNLKREPDDYVFDILQPGLNPKQEMGKVKQATKTINKYINRIATKLDIEKHVTTYTARHSFSTVLKRSGVPVEFISESLGHQDKRTTEIYLDSFDDETRRKYSESLTNFPSSQLKAV